jgi:Fe-S cluster assembly iron-binding protein IscA
MTFSITAPAVQEILAAAARSDALGLALRVAAKGTPDGIDYGMGFDEPAEDDEIQDFSGLTVVVGAPSRRWLEGTVLDYVEIEPGRHDFIFVATAAGAGCATQSTSAARSTSKGCGGGGCSGCGGH